MGGDDLSDDDEYLDYSPSGDGHSSDDGNGGGGDSKKKRKGDGNSSLAASDDDDDDEVEVHEKKTDRKKRNKTELLTSSSSLSSTPQDVLLHAGRGIAMDNVEAQSTFLNTLYSHSIKLVNGAASSNSKKVVVEEEEEEEETASTTDIITTAIATATTTYSFLPHLYTLPKELDMSTKVYRHANLNSFLKPSSSGNGGGPLSSNKKLKNWKYPTSPMIIVITLSAVRAVELMKQLSSTLKLPMLKLFAKHMSLEEQVRLLSQGFGKKKNIDNKQTTKNLSSSSSKKGSKGSGGYYSLAVGTPGRLLKLLRYDNNCTTNTDEVSRGGDMGNARRGCGALQLHHTELVIIDCHTDSKGWNVLTLNDTSTELMQFMNEGVINQLEKRKGKLKLALF